MPATLTRPELEDWARAAAARHQERVAVGTVLTGVEAKIVVAIDDYAAKHALAGRRAVVREDVSQLHAALAERNS